MAGDSRPADSSVAKFFLYQSEELRDRGPGGAPDQFRLITLFFGFLPGASLASSAWLMLRRRKAALRPARERLSSGRFLFGFKLK